MGDLISVLATFLTIETGIVPKIRDIKTWKDRRAFRKLPETVVEYDKVAEDAERYAAAADEYIAKTHSDNEKVIGDEDYLRFKEVFYNSHREMIPFKDDVDLYLDSYLDQLNHWLAERMTLGEKLLNKRTAELSTDVREIRDLMEKDKSENGKMLEEVWKTVVQPEKELEETFMLIDDLFLEKHKSENYEECRFEYYNVERTSDSIFKAILNGVIISTDEYEEICAQIYHLIRYSAVLFLMANSSTGKSTLLCKTAVRLAKDGYKVYFVDRSIEIKRFGKIEEETFFLFDNASNNTAVLAKLYDLFKDNRYVHVVICDRIHRINNIIDEIGLSRWCIYGDGIVFQNSGTDQYNSLLREKNLVKIELSAELRKKMSDGEITSTVDFEELDNGLVEKVMRKLNYRDRSVTDIILEFLVQYNLAAGENVRPSKRHLWDWDVWDEVKELKGSFKYLAALNLYGVNVTIRQMEYITGAEINRLVNEGKLQVVRLVDNVIRLRHDTIADNYFKFNRVKPADVIKEMFERRLMTEDTVVKFEREAFSLSNIFRVSEEVKNLHIPELIHAFNRIESYKEILIEHQRIHSFELAAIGVNAEKANNKEKYYRERIGKSFEKIWPVYANKRMLWLKYFFFSVDHADSIPEEMLMPLPNDGLYKKVTEAVDNYIRRTYRNLSKEEQEKWILFLEQLFRWIIENIDRNDVPGRILLLWVYQHSGNVERARKVVHELSDLEESMKRMAEFSVAYIQVYENEVRQLVRLNRTDPKIREINRFIKEYYKDLVAYTDRNSEEYITVVRSYVRFQKDCGDFNSAYHQAKETVEYMVENNPQIPVYRLYIELGMICQFKNSRNDHFGNEEAIMWFQNAVEQIDRSSRDLLYVLKPLCKTYLSVGRYEECLATCKKIKELDFRDNEVKNLQYEAIRLQRIKELNLPVGKQYRWEEKPKPEELESEFKKLIDHMTEEQLAFTKMFELMQHKSRFGAYRAAFSIKNNIYIPVRILSQLKINDTTIVDELLCMT